MPDPTQNDPNTDAFHVLRKLRAAITYLAISEVMQYLQDTDIRTMDIALIGMITYVISGSFLHVIHDNAARYKTQRRDGETRTALALLSIFDVQERIVQSINRLSIMMSAQSLAIWAQPAEFDESSVLTAEQTLSIVMWVVAMVTVLSLLPGGFIASQQGASFQSVLLYTFTNGIETQFYKMGLDTFVLSAMSLALLYYLQCIHNLRGTTAAAGGTGDNTGDFRSMLHEAACMVLTNVCISNAISGTESSHTYKNVLFIAQLFGGVILVSFLGERIALAESVQTLILWRASREVWEWVYYFTSDAFAILIMLCIAYAIMRKVQIHIAMTLILVLSKHIVSMSLHEIKHMPQLASIVASQMLLVVADIVTARIVQETE
jgi:hypothetical protein